MNCFYSVQFGGFSHDWNIYEIYNYSEFFILIPVYLKHALDINKILFIEEFKLWLINCSLLITSFISAVTCNSLRIDHLLFKTLVYFQCLKS